MCVCVNAHSLYLIIDLFFFFNIKHIRALGMECILFSWLPFYQFQE